jgi:hypothetical protein
MEDKKIILVIGDSNSEVSDKISGFIMKEGISAAVIPVGDFPGKEKILGLEKFLKHADKAIEYGEELLIKEDLSEKFNLKKGRRREKIRREEKPIHFVFHNGRRKDVRRQRRGRR